MALMFEGQTRLRTRRLSLAATAVLGLALVPALGRAGSMAELASHVSKASLHAPMELCVGVSRSASCRSTIDTAIRAATSQTTLRGRLSEALTSGNPPHQTLPASFANEAGESGGRSLALKFNDDPEWKRRAKVMARDGLPFMRLPQSGNRELLVGITPHGMLGFSLQDKTTD